MDKCRRQKNSAGLEDLEVCSDYAQRHDTNELSVGGMPAECVPCPSCDAEDSVEYTRYRDLDCGVPGLWRLVRCKRCDLIFMNPRPTVDAFHLVYPPNYVPYQMDLRPDTRWLMKFAIMTAYEGAKLKILDRVDLPEKPRILDVGCGAGFFLELLKRRGWEPVGIEPNQELVKRATEELGLDVREGTLSTGDLEPESFDVVTLWHCLEHYPTPRETLTHCRRLLKRGGFVITQVPDNDSWEDRRLGNYFWSNDIPRHLIFLQR